MRRETFIRATVVACALLLSSLSAPAHAGARQQGATLSGRVTDARGAGLPGATVTLRERARTQGRLSTQTDAAGAYRFERLAPGEYIVEAEAPGFAAAADARVLSVARDVETTLDVRLEVAGVSTEVVVTAADTPQTADEVSKAVTAVTAREMDERLPLRRDAQGRPDGRVHFPALRVAPAAPVRQGRERLRPGLL